MSGHLVIGIDLDNTLACYDALFHRVACEEGLISSSLPKSKEQVRDAIRRLPDGETRWTRLQAMVYGPRIDGAVLFEGIGAFLRHCTDAGARVRIVSHKTHHAALDGTSVDLRESALGWMTAQGFFDPSCFALSRDEVFFESTRAEKIGRIRSLRCTHFIDDLIEVFAEAAFPADTEKFLFAPHGAPVPPPDICVFGSWREIETFLFDAGRL